MFIKEDLIMTLEELNAIREKAKEALAVRNGEKK